jgi:hypothetical protein
LALAEESERHGDTAAAGRLREEAQDLLDAAGALATNMVDDLDPEQRRRLTETITAVRGNMGPQGTRWQVSGNILRRIADHSTAS